MKIAITGGSGFVGRHLALRLAAEGHELVLLARGVDRRQALVPGTSFVAGGLADPLLLERALAGCEAVAHCAGINREIGEQTYQAVHVNGTLNVVQAAGRA
jgi:nucleoside-diphosphate-sugar epimerase